MKRHVKKVMEHLMGPTGSILLHVVIVIVLVRLVYFATTPSDPEVEVVMLDPETIDLDELREELRELEIQQTIDTLAPPDLSMEMDMPDVADIPDFAPPADTDFSALDVVDTVQSPLVISGLYGNRGEEGRRAALARFGGSAETERAVLKALEWLRTNQREDGYWDPGDRRSRTAMHRVGYSGLALLAFLSHGETPDKPHFGPTVERAIRAIANGQDADGWYANPASDSGHGVYAHAIATYAMSEAYAMTRIPSLKGSIERAVRLIIQGQQRGGGWDYYFRDEGRRDTSVGGWCLQAMKAAQMAGAQVDGLQRALDRGLEDFRRAQHPEGFFGYTTPARNIPNTGIAVLCFKLLGRADDQAARRGVQTLREHATVDWNDPGQWAFSAWYYITQAKFHEGGNVWTRWNREFSRTLIRNQNEDGSWVSPSPYEASHGQTYSTALGAMTLMVYYRFLPTYQVDPTAATAVGAVDFDDDEDLITIL